jgi:uncharacterized protein YdaU (DUF1376 family)
MKHPWMPFYVQDFQADTMDLEVDEIGVYVVLLCLAWQRGGTIPADELSLKKLLKRCFATFHGHTYNRIVPKLLARYFDLEDGFYTNKRLTKEKQKADKLSAKQKQKADKRWADVRENNVLADAAAMPSTITTTITTTKKEEVGGADAPPPEKVVPIRRYAFEGRIAKVSQADLERWRNSYHAIPDFLAALQAADDYYSENPPKDGKWFFPVSRWLQKEHDQWGEKIRVANARPDRSF